MTVGTVVRQSGLRSALAATLAVFLVNPAFGQQAANQEAIITPVRPEAPILWRPYQAPYVPPISLTNSGRLGSLVRAGKLYLTVQDAVALALENNIDVQVSRYTPILDAWSLERAQAGGALPGVPSGSSQVGSVARGQGVKGSQAAAGVSGINGGGANTNTANATISQIGPVTQNLDTVIQDSSVFSHTSSPQANIRQSQVVNLVDNTRNYTASLQQGFIFGGQASLTYVESYLNENSPTNVLNPTYAPVLQLSVQQPLLQGFGTAVNSRTINVAKINLRIDDLNFKSQIIAVVVSVLQSYYTLVADYDDLKAKQSAAQVAQQFYENNQKQVQIGTLAPLDVTTAQSQVASTQNDLVTSQSTLAEGQLQLKNLLSRTGVADPILENVEIIPLDRIDVPQQETLPSLQELVKQALANRVDIAAQRMNLEVAQTNSLGTTNTLLPTVTVFSNASNAGLAGTSQPVPQTGPQAAASASQAYPPGFQACPPPNQNVICEVADPFVTGGLGTALGQVFRRNFPSESVGGFASIRIRNRQAQADYRIDQLTIRQTELNNQKTVNQISVDVANQVTSLRQAQARYQAAVKNRILAQQLLDAEQKKFSLGASTPYLVVSQERDLSTAQSSEVAALVAYSNARVNLGQTVGTTLDDVHVSLKDAHSGQVARISTLPDRLPQTTP